MRKLYGAGLESLLINTRASRHPQGAHGFKFYSPHSEAVDLYVLEFVKSRTEPSALELSRQAPDTVHLLFAVNGLPAATCELKNPGLIRIGGTPDQ